ncbi:F-box/kelch-repeat protein At3g23880-like [Silene latifolia]|uniref:F-box/kelch-repeat protein At3g23880-like n=1 Tax=Silene latifolia TaxID=37657 RepID=UPI003D783369
MKLRKKAKSSSSNSFCFSESMYIPLELLTQILAYLPVKSLVRFRSVCKSWCSIIDHPDFVHMQLLLCRSNNNNKYDSGKLLSLECSGYPDYDGCWMALRKVHTLRKVCHVFKRSEGYDIKGICKSLVLICSQQFRPNGLRICNPSIRKSLLLPPCPLLPSQVYMTAFVFGFVPRSKDFKVIAILYKYFCCARRPELPVAVYTLSDQQWTVRKNGLNMDVLTFSGMFKSHYFLPNPYYYDGAVYWLGNDPSVDSSDDLCSEPTHLVSLDLDTENFEFLELPIIAIDETQTTSLVFLLGESLAVFSISSVRSAIWVLKRENNKREWSQWFSGPSSVDGCNLFGQKGSREIARLLYYEGDGGYFVYGNESYNIATCKVGKRRKFLSHGAELETYSESLVLCKGYGAEDMASSPF